MGRLVLVAFLLFLIPISYSAANEIKVIVPSFSSGSFDAIIEINSTIPLAGAQSDFSFNGSVIHAIGVENGGMFKIWGGNFSNIPIIDNKNGTIKDIVAFSIDNTSNKGNFAIIHFKAINEGESCLDIENAMLSDKNANKVEASIHNASVIIDSTPPKIKNVSIKINGNVNISCQIIEPYLQYAKINITSPNGSKKEFYMNGNNPYFFSHSFSSGNYSFFIMARDKAGNDAISSSYKFSIGEKNSPPVKPYSPNPANGNIVPINTALSWKCNDPDGDALSYDIYFGTSPSPSLKAHNQSSNIYSPNLEYGKKYYWRVVAWDGHGNKNSSEIWHFYTEKNYAPVVEINSPSNGSIVNGTITIKGVAWDKNGNDTIKKVEIRIDNGAWKVANGITSWSYNMDTRLLVNGKHVVKVRCYDGSSYSNVSSIIIDIENEQIRRYTLTISVYPYNAGYTTPQRGTYDEGTKVTINAYPNNGYQFDHWGGAASGSQSTIVVTMNGDKSIVAYFKEIPNPPPPPNIDFSYSPTNPYAGETVHFYGKGNADLWHWDFGDGNTSSEQNPSHLYEKPGKYNVILEAIINGKKYDKKETIEVKGKESADFTFNPSHPSPGMIVHFYGKGENILKYEWEFGDGSFAYGKNVSHVYSLGDYNVTLHIVDRWGNSDNKSKEIVVQYPDFIVKDAKYSDGIIKATVSNNGGDAKNVSIAFYLNGEEIGEKKVNLFYGDSIEVDESVKTKKGENKIEVIADPNNDFKEENEDNNVFSMVIGKENTDFLPYIAIALIAIAPLSYILLHKKKEKITITSDDKEARCTVCLGKFKPNSEIVKCECGALFHKSCAERVKVCPICGRKLV